MERQNDTGTMTDIEFQILDELYFVTSYKNLLEISLLQENALSETLCSMIDQGLVKVLFPDPDTEINFTEEAGISLQNCYFLASKAGLLAHNSR